MRPEAKGTETGGGTGSLVRRAALPGAPLLALAVYLLLPGSYPDPAGAPVPFSHAGRATAALAVWMAAWWITEAIPVYATGLLPLVLLPVVGAATIRETSSPYGNELIFLFLGGFILALGIERWGLHRRVAFAALRCVGTRPDRIVGGIMGVTAALSMWMSNTAVAITMLPIAMSVVDLARPGPGGGAASREDRNFSLCLLLGVAYASSIGGVGTLVGTPPNLFLASFVRQHLGAEISFVRWMGIGVPLVLVYLPAAWWLLTHVLYPVGVRPIGEGADRIRQAHRGLGPMRRGEWVTLAVFGTTASLWILRPLLTDLEFGGLRPLAGLTDTGVAMTGAVALFLIPVERGGRRFAMDWETAARLPWGVLILFGGGLSLAAAIEANGVAELLGSRVGTLAGLPPLLLVVAATTLVIFLTEITSNTATAAAVVPLLAALAPGLGLHPYLLIVPAAIAASCAFMLPVATPPNAIVFGTGHVTIPQMCRAGLWLNLLGIALITALTYGLVLPLLGTPPVP